MWVWQSHAPGGTSNRTGVRGCDAAARMLVVRRTARAAAAAARTSRSRRDNMSITSLENALRQPHVHAVIRLVDQLRDRDVAGDADQLIRRVLVHLPGRRD